MKDSGGGRCGTLHNTLLHHDMTADKGALHILQRLQVSIARACPRLEADKL